MIAKNQMLWALPGMTLVLLLFTAGAKQTASAYEAYGSGCINSSCHGDFGGPTSPKGTLFPSGKNHEMHRASTSMNTACDLCHSGTQRTPVFIGSSDGTANNPGLGCTGCHVAAGLREHHFRNGITECYDCHDPAVSPAENIKPPYYGTADTRADNPGNPVQVANTNENWSLGDFLGLDNDGNNLYDLADYAVGPNRVTSAVPVGKDMLVTWQTAGGRTEYVQATKAIGTPFADVSLPITIPGVGMVTTNYLDRGGATNSSRFYRLKGIFP